MSTAKSHTVRSQPAGAARPSVRDQERPIPSGANVAGFGSDVVADTLRDLDIPYIALNPGASYRGLHDSLVNYLGNDRPQMLLCLHEESAVSIAQGFAKVTGRAMAAVVHSNVGLFHATMSIFNAWCDRTPVVVLGACGPIDFAKRRPWIDWIHTARDQGAVVRNYTKWDDLVLSPAEARVSLTRAHWIAHTAPRGPVYVNLDAGMQEARLDAPLPPFDAARHAPAAPVMPPADAIAQAARMLKAAKRPVILMGRVSRSVERWYDRVALAEALSAEVVTDLKIACGFPSDHPLHAGPPASMTPAGTAADAIVGADVILNLDAVDPAGIMQVLFKGEAPKAKIISVTLDQRIHNGWSLDYQGLPPVDLMLAAEPDDVVPVLLDALGIERGAPKPVPVAPRPTPPAGPLTVDHLAHALRAAIGNRDVTLTHLPLSWNGASWPFNHPLDFIGAEGGGGIGAGPGITVGAALALKDTGRIPLGIVGDGDFLMGVTALWTATHYRIPLMMVIANNRSFFNDELHQERVARMRNRPVENRWIGQKIFDPDIDLAAMARAQGAVGFGPVTEVVDLPKVFAQAIAAYEGGNVAVVDVRVEPGYTGAATAEMMRGAAPKA